jgi:hypothetical protein
MYQTVHVQIEKTTLQLSTESKETPRKIIQMRICEVISWQGTSIAFVSSSMSKEIKESGSSSAQTN